MTDKTTPPTDAPAAAPVAGAHHDQADVPAARPDPLSPQSIARHTDGSRAVPPLVRATSEWAARLLVIGVGLYALAWVLRQVSEIVVPVAIAVLLTALLGPLAKWLQRWMPAGPATGLTLVGLLVVVGGLFTLVGSQFSSGFSDLTNQVAGGLEQVRDWVRTTFKITDSQFNDYFDTLRQQVGNSGNLGDTASSIGLSATHFVAGIFIALFAFFFFTYQGSSIWAWVVQLFPRVARPRVNSSGLIAWGQLSAFVRATVIVALVDAIGIGLGAAILKVPFALAIGILVFLFAFIPIVGALLSGAVAVLLALVAHGPGIALIMLAVVIAVQQVESHVLQPFLLGKAVHVHPLAVILAVAGGSVVAGIVGALTAVPFAAVVNAVGRHLLSGETPDDIRRQLEETADEGGSTAQS
ncbi:AI-2E family transporter [Terracoccus luteus]|uniref:Putative PurR-regulated permease PerM n=1 Tax=Terracoccus luteus TaxID=53356 RepID=A0A839PVL5_9MICO|nr:AI-2E family transporter [Terracoccus luteus]MBB2986016.1 putative PurR-regulated permease PerM [Terracoccus luteus]MCP2171668.1 putative PurR-regulated permease PerM [Terracoccus luteus]